MKISPINSNSCDVLFQSLNDVHNKLKNEGDAIEAKFNQNPLNNFDSYQSTISNMYNQLKDEITKFALGFSKNITSQLDKIGDLHHKIHDFENNIQLIAQNSNQMFSESIIQPIPDIQVIYQPSPAFLETDSIYNDIKLGSPIVIHPVQANFEAQKLIRKVSNDDGFDPDYFDIEKSFGQSSENDIFQGRIVTIRLPEVPQKSKKKNKSK